MFGRNYNLEVRVRNPNEGLITTDTYTLHAHNPQKAVLFAICHTPSRHPGCITTPLDVVVTPASPQLRQTRR